MQFCISDIIFHMDFSHFQVLENLTTRVVAICANSDINRLFIDVQLFKCSSKQQEDEACVNICSDSLSLLSHQNSHCLSQTTVIVSFIWFNIFVIFLNISFILHISFSILTHPFLPPKRSHLLRVDFARRVWSWGHCWRKLLLTKVVIIKGGFLNETIIL